MMFSPSEQLFFVTGNINIQYLFRRDSCIGDCPENCDVTKNAQPTMKDGVLHNYYLIVIHIVLNKIRVRC